MSLRHDICDALKLPDYPPIGLDQALTIKRVVEWCAETNTVLDLSYFPGRASLKFEVTLDAVGWYVVKSANNWAEAIAEAWLEVLR